MLGVLQRGAGPAKARCLLCRPIAQEAVRTAAVFRVMADRLAREGCDSLRFDYHGTGDSPGDEHEQSMPSWVDDVLAAHDSLCSGSEPVPVLWFGMGLGATLALQAAAVAAVPPQRLLLWNPVLAGRTYSQALLEAHRAELEREFGYPWEDLMRVGKASEPALPGDVLGFDFGQPLVDDFAQLTSLNVAAVLQRDVQVTCAVPQHELALLASVQADARLKLHVIESPINWMLSQAMGTAIVPPDLLRTLMATLD